MCVYKQNYMMINNMKFRNKNMLKYIELYLENKKIIEK